VTGSPSEARTPQQDRSRRTRTRLLEAAVSCLAEVGWTRSTVAMVAERAGVSRGAAQHHFPTREALFVAAVEHVANQRSEEIRRQVAVAGEGKPSTRQVVELIVDVYTGPLFRAALALWVASASEPELREQVVPVEARLGRQVHRITVDLLGVDESVPGVRESIQATLDLARGLGLANLLTDDSARRSGVVERWAELLDASLRAVPA
jgi:AcrR family transcriptional regulator